MLLTEYAATLARIVDDYSNTELIVDSTVAADCRTAKIGVIRGTIIFVDGSSLFFTEYLDLRYRAEKLTYSFHYQDCDGAMLFRYDNARHKPACDFPDHKHLADGRALRSEVPELSGILEEIMGYFL
ncbi:MAG: hypothetical protein HZA20_01090 [Nitrospirae bacterium]|nr:hypothetical protein [Nitrospirota bacterium]